MSQVIKPSHLKNLGQIEISDLQAKVRLISEKVWSMENEDKENNFECFHHTRHIIFRFIRGMRDHRVFYSNPIWDFWQNELLPIMEKTVVSYNFAKPLFPKVMLARLAAGAVIDKHRDGAGSNLYTHKIHIPLQTNERARMFILDDYFHLNEGNAYEVNNLVQHAAENLGTEDRIHLIFEVFDGANQAG